MTYLHDVRDLKLTSLYLSVVMIDTSQWRASIGLWYCHQISYTTKKGTTTDFSRWVESLLSGGSRNEGCGNLTFFLVLFLLLLLILSGDIELNPGPKTGKH